MSGTSPPCDDGTLRASALQLRTVFLPQWYTNPYLTHLDHELRSLGVRSARFSQNPLAVAVGILRARPHVLHLHWLHPFYENRSKRRSRVRLAVSLMALRLLRLMGVRIIWTAHNLGDHEAKGSSIDRDCTHFVARHAAAIIAHGESAKRRLLKELPIADPERVFVIPHGHYINSYPNTVDRATARAKIDLPESSVVYLFLGQIRPYKGVLEMIEAFGKLESDDARLVIAGKPLSDADGDVVRRAAASDRRIKLSIGFVPDDDLQLYLGAADAVVLPYRDILTSGAAVLAMSFARPCVVPRLDCFTDLLDEEGAVFYDADRDDGLVGGLRDALRRRTELDAMGAHNLDLAQQWHWPGVARQTLDVYRFALGRRA